MAEVDAMNINWFKNPDHVVYAEEEQFTEAFEKEAGIADLAEQIRRFREHPVQGGKILKGKRRTSLKLFIPDLEFDEHLELGENVWIYLGENYECYCLYQPLQQGEDKAKYI